jgi:hypothetical protein
LLISRRSYNTAPKKRNIVLSKSIALSAVYITSLLISKLIIDGGRYSRVNKQKLILRVVIVRPLM